MFYNEIGKSIIDKLKNTVVLFGFFIGVSIIGYFGMNWIINVPRTKPQIKKIETKNIIVDSLLVVVDSLTVQVDSLHRAGNKTNTVFIPQNVDTTFIIEQHFKTLKHTIKHRDKNLDFKLGFDLLQNKVQSPKLEYKILQPTAIITQKSNHLFAGATVGGSQFELDQFTPEIIFFTGKHGFKIGYNLLNPNRNLQIGYYFKIK